MVKTLIIISKPPSSRVIDGFYTALGIIGEVEVNILLIDDGVYRAIKGQKGLNMSSVEDCIYSLYPEARVYAYKFSLVSRSVKPIEMVEIVKTIDEDESLKLIENSEIIINI